MENKQKEPLMSAEGFYKTLNKNYTITELMQKYATYHTNWHLNNAKDFVADNTKKADIQGFGIVEIIDKQSITTAIDNYIKDNL